MFGGDPGFVLGRGGGRGGGARHGQEAKKGGARWKSEDEDGGERRRERRTKWGEGAGRVCTSEASEDVDKEETTSCNRRCE